jgi:hypothetical protein
MYLETHEGMVDLILEAVSDTVKALNLDLTWT